MTISPIKSIVFLSLLGALSVAACGDDDEGPSCTDASEGCRCDASEQETDGICANGVGLECVDGRWERAKGEEGPCFLPEFEDEEPISLEECGIVLGKPKLDPGDGSVLDTGCLDRQESAGEISDGTRVIGLCCRPVAVTAEECVAFPADILADPGDGSLIEAGCPDNRLLLGLISSTDPALCCGK